MTDPIKQAIAALRTACDYQILHEFPEGEAAIKALEGLAAQPQGLPVGIVQVMGRYGGRPSLGCLLTFEAETRVKVGDKLYATPQPAMPVVPQEMRVDFTDTARAALLWVLWHHQGGSSKVGQPIRFALGMGAHDHLNDHQVAEAKRWASISGNSMPNAAPPIKEGGEG
jgi:hypothetical protein